MIEQILKSSFLKESNGKDRKLLNWIKINFITLTKHSILSKMKKKINYNYKNINKNYHKYYGKYIDYDWIAKTLSEKKKIDMNNN